MGKVNCTERGQVGSWDSDIFVAYRLVDMYAKCGSMADAWIFNIRGWKGAQRNSQNVNDKVHTFLVNH